MGDRAKLILWGMVGTVLFGAVVFTVTIYYGSQQRNDKVVSAKKEYATKSIKDENSEHSVMSSSSIAVDSTEALDTEQGPQITPITFEEGMGLIDKVGGEIIGEDAKVIASDGPSITIGGGVGAKGYDKITFTPDEAGNVTIHYEFGTLEGGSYSSIASYMPEKDYVTTR
ncbi:hypothetical protein [Weissella bombi]|uniref:Uncharacterized protein n=1 Tax=Weissella bombi TaxID=1505725 RepID=A0A1C4B823_9LACO|nr:hypothetical protein [Weissella bombi]SCC02964.1 hypothetical protein GA0061074_10931 [Weissella bombi]